MQSATAEDKIAERNKQNNRQGALAAPFSPLHRQPSIESLPVLFLHPPSHTAQIAGVEVLVKRIEYRVIQRGADVKKIVARNVVEKESKTVRAQVLAVAGVQIKAIKRLGA